MLVLSRRPGEKIRIGTGVTLTVVEVQGRRVVLGIDAPNSMRILRGELCDGADEPIMVWSEPTGEDSPRDVPASGPDL